MLRHFFWIQQHFNSIITSLEKANRKIEYVLNAKNLSSTELQNTILDLKKCKSLNIDKLNQIEFTASEDYKDGFKLLSNVEVNDNNIESDRLDYKIYSNLMVDDLAEYGFEVVYNEM